MMKAFSSSLWLVSMMAIIGLGLSACSETDTRSLAREQTVSEKQPVSEVKSAKASAPDITVTVLGSGTPMPTADQYGAAILVQAGGKDLLFDCGRGCTSRLVQVDRDLITGIEHLFLTHLHSDHIVGVDDLWLNGWTQGRNAPMKVFGPPGTIGFFTHLKQAFDEDIKVRIKKGLPATIDGISLAEIKKISEDQIVLNEDGVVVTAFLVDHQPVEPAFGFRIDYAGRSVIISGDTKPSDNLVNNAMDADVILHELFSPSLVNYVRTNFTKEQYEAIVGIHTTVEQASVIFARTKPRLGVYYHLRLTPKDKVDALSVTSEYYNGRVEVSQDLFQIKIGDDITTTVLEP